MYYDDAMPFKHKHWEALCRYQEQQNKTETTRKEYYRILNKGIQFTNYVGVIQAGVVIPRRAAEVDGGIRLAFARGVKCE